MRKQAKISDKEIKEVKRLEKYWKGMERARAKRQHQTGKESLNAERIQIAISDYISEQVDNKILDTYYADSN